MISIVFQPNGRFETGKKICLSISGYHPETWQPSWSIRTALLALIGFMPTPGQGTIGSLDYPPEERKKLAKKSTSFSCDECCSEGSSITSLLKTREEEQNEDSANEKQARAEEAKKLASQVSFKVSPGIEIITGSIKFYRLYKSKRDMTMIETMINIISGKKRDKPPAPKKRNT